MRGSKAHTKKRKLIPSCTLETIVLNCLNLKHTLEYIKTHREAHLINLARSPIDINRHVEKRSSFHHAAWVLS